MKKLTVKSEVDAEYEQGHLKAKAQLSSMGIVFKQDEFGTFKFVVPKKVSDELREVYKFSFDQLKIGADIPLGVLAEHVDEQSSKEAKSGVLAEFLRHYHNDVNIEYDIWYGKVFQEVRLLLQGKPTEKIIHNYIITKYEKQYRKWQKKLNDAEYAYRIANTIRSAWLTKGRLLQTLRVIVQGSGSGEVYLKVGERKNGDD